MNWKELNSESQLNQIKEASFEKPVVIFKHSTRCSISSTAKSRLERKWNSNFDKNITFFFLDLLSFRGVSNAVAEQLGVVHQSPQIILIKNGKAVFDASHLDIDLDQVVKLAEA